MERMYPYKESVKIDALLMMIENQVEYLVDDEDPELAEVSHLDEREYNIFIESIFNDLWQDDVWFSIDEKITNFAKKRLRNIQLIRKK